MKGPLILSQYNTGQQIYIPSRIVEKLTPYQIDGIRFLHQQYIKNQSFILNNDSGMNEERQISAFLSAIERQNPTLIVCQHHCLIKWYYEFSQTNMKIVTANELIKDELWDKSDLPDAVVLTHDQLKHIKILPIQHWFFVVVQHLENLMNSRYIKNINADIRIGIVTTSFVDLTPDLQWFAMKWTNSNLVDSKQKFIEANDFNKANILCPFPSYWKRTTWDIFKKFKPTELYVKEYDRAINKWCEDHNSSLLATDKPERQKSIRKRSSMKKKSNVNKKLKKRCVTSKQKYKKTSSSSDIDSTNNDISYQKTSSDGEDSKEMFDKNLLENQNSAGSNYTLVDENISILGDHLTDNPQSILNENDIKIRTKENITRVPETKCKNKSESILDSLIDTPEQNYKIGKGKEFSISDDENESFRILDFLVN